MEIRDVPVEDLVLDPNLNLRDRLDEFAVERYADAWERMPPVTVFEVEGQWLLADGFHRHAAAMRLSRRTIPAEVREGTMADALDFVSGINAFHGLPWTRAERRRAVEVKIRLHPDWSDRRLAEDLGAGRDLVGRVRKNLVDSGQLAASASRVGADGKVYPATSLPRDPNEHLPRDRMGGGQEDPRDRGRSEADPIGWDDTVDPMPPVNQDGPGSYPAPPWDTADAKVMALAPPVATAAPSIEEMLNLMTNQVNEVIAWTQSEGFAEAYRTAGPNARTLFQTSALKLAAQADLLRKG
ncbi:ParB/RepB/Spo0J family partition protein [Tundrisphaera sp. TA3]|uniref:ParB/RepB/Spo0J family partition protein n=1 Tax=Tundrisphaera sp. TA3 TaxID=3435775 RepID=UPI003EB71D1A